MSKSLKSVLLATALFCTAVPAMAQEDQTFDAKQADAIRRIVRSYLMENPEVIIEATEALREKARMQAEDEAKKAITARAAELFANDADPIAGNPKGDVVIVEYFDYNCPYCKVVTDPLLEAAKADGKVKIVYKELPILTASSRTAAMAALAAKKLGKYDVVHAALMKYRGRLDDKTIFKLIGDAGVNVDQVKAEMASPEIEAILLKNAELANAIDISSTPTFVVAKPDGTAARIVPGAVEGNVLRQLIDITRKGGKL